MNKLIVALEDVRRWDVAQVGAKAAVLGTLLDAGFPVPPGVCLTTDAFRLALGAWRHEIDVILHEGDLRDPKSAALAAAKIAERLTRLQVPASVSTALSKALPRISAQDRWLAIRSSATAEDAADASFAGQYTSVLGVRGDEAVENAIVAVWCSFFGPNALLARATHDRLEREAMAVLIQPMIHADCAGVCFSVDPVSRRRDLIVVNAAWGIGPGVVDGSVAADTTWLRRDALDPAGSVVKKQHVVDKAEQIGIHPGGDLQRIAVPEKRRSVPCIPEPWLQRVGQFGVAAELTLGRPQDLEWAIADEQVWILQSRPITALPPELVEKLRFPFRWENDQDRRRYWSLRELTGQESAPLLPLERDHQATVEEMREETCRFMGADRNGKLAFFNGRAYFCRLPLDLMEGDIRVRRAALEDLKARLQRQGLTAWDFWGPEAVRATERLKAFDAERADGPQLAEHLEDALAARRRHYMLHPLCWFKPRLPFFDAFEKVSGVTGESAETAAYQLLDGEETPLTRRLDGLYALARTARQAPGVAALVAEPPHDVLERLNALPDAAAFRAQLDDFLADYGVYNGDGWGSEATILTPTWCEQPQQIFKLIAPYLDPGIESPGTARARAQRARNAKVEALCAACTDEAAVARFRRELAYARRTMTVLEYHNHYLNQLAIGQLRHAVLGAARWLVARGALVKPDEVFWLRFDEILEALRAGTAHAAGAHVRDSLASIIAARQAEQVRWEELEAPPFLGVPDARLPERPPFEDGAVDTTPGPGGVLTGLGASPGRYRGRARIVATVTPLPDLSPGDVLVTENAGPRWTPLFPILGALVLDSGSFGQHAAATAREYGVPAVIQTRNATQMIPDGASVVVDGTNGTVELDSRPDEAISEL